MTTLISYTQQRRTRETAAVPASRQCRASVRAGGDPSCCWPLRWPLNPDAGGVRRRRPAADVVEHLTSTYKSDGTPKGTIFVNGEPVKELKGVYGLDALRFLASALGVDCPDAIGHGFESRNIQAALNRHFKATTPHRAT